MNETITPTEDVETITPAPGKEKNSNTKAPVKTLESIVQAIRLDALYDSLKYVLRSDRGHDGE